MAENIVGASIIGLQLVSRITSVGQTVEWLTLQMHNHTTAGCLQPLSIVICDKSRYDYEDLTFYSFYLSIRDNLIISRSVSYTRRLDNEHLLVLPRLT